MPGSSESFWHILKLAAKYYFRRTIGGVILSAGILLFVVAASGWGIKFDYENSESKISFNFTSGDATPNWVTIILFIVGFILIICGFIILLLDFLQGRQERRAALQERERRRVVVIEQRGLHSRLDAPLINAVPARLEGHRVPLILNHGTVSMTGEADRWRLINDAKQLRRDVRQAIGDTPPSLTSILYGGVAPVPITFLAGCILDDEGAVMIMDWDRVAGRWRELDGPDDGERFLEPDLSRLSSPTPEVMLAVSVSYNVDLAGVESLSDGNPIIILRLAIPRIGNHWSDEKQHELTSKFLELISQLQNFHVCRIHLFIAAPSSIIFRFGRHYDGRNMPEIIVYQYERSGPWRFPWGIRMPCHGAAEPSIQLNDHYPPLDEEGA